MERRLSRLLAAIAVFVAATLPFARTADFGLINLDDYAYAENDEHSSLSARAVVHAFADVSQHIWMPLTWISYAIDREAARRFMPDPSAEGCDHARPFPVHRLMHVHSVALHGVNAVLLLALLSCVFRGRVSLCACAAAALLWAMHPLRCESVCWIASRKDLLSMAFLLAALLAWCRHLEAGGRVLPYVAAFACLCLGVMAKPSVMTFPALAFLLDAFFLRRGREWHVRDILPYVPFLLVAAAAGIAAKSFQDFGESIMPGYNPSVAWRLMNAVNSIGVYILHTVFPGRLAVQCVSRYPAMPRLWTVAIPVAIGVLWLAVSWAADALRRVRAGSRRLPCGRMAVPGLLWFLVSVAPMLGVAGFGYHAFADRFTYIPAIGFSLMVCEVWAVALRREPCRIVFAVVSFCALAALGVASFRQAGFWRNDGLLFSRTLEVDGDANYAAHFNLGFYAWEFTHDLDRCIAHYECAYAANPNFVAYSGMAPYVMALCEKGRASEAGTLIPAFSAAERGTFGTARSSGFYAARGMWFLASGMVQGARDELTVLERDTPGSAHRHFLAMKVAEYDGDLKAAASHVAFIRRLACLHTPDYARYRYLCAQSSDHPSKD